MIGHIYHASKNKGKKLENTESQRDHFARIRNRKGVELSAGGRKNSFTLTLEKKEEISKKKAFKQLSSNIVGFSGSNSELKKVQKTTSALMTRPTHIHDIGPLPLRAGC